MVTYHVYFYSYFLLQLEKIFGNGKFNLGVSPIFLNSKKETYFEFLWGRGVHLIKNTDILPTLEPEQKEVQNK